MQLQVVVNKMADKPGLSLGHAASSYRCRCKKKLPEGIAQLNWNHACATSQPIPGVFSEGGCAGADMVDLDVRFHRSGASHHKFAPTDPGAKLESKNQPGCGY